MTDCPVCGFRPDAGVIYHVDGHNCCPECGAAWYEDRRINRVCDSCAIAGTCEIKNGCVGCSYWRKK